MRSLRELFGPSRDEIWSQLSQEIGAEYEKGSFLKSGKVVCSHRQWEITLDAYTVNTGKSSATFTRIRAPYVNMDGFRFTVYRKGVFSGVGKLFGMQDIEIGDPVFDDAFVVRSTSESLVQRLLSNARIRELLLSQPAIHFQVKDDEGWFGKKFPEGVDELYFQTQGVIKDKQVLKNLFDLFSVVLDELCMIGSAYENGPGVKLT